MSNKEQPISLFTKCFDEELKLSKVRIPTAVCLSTIGIDNYPNARFVSFKGLVENCFVITGPLNSRKGIEIENNENVALTFWWPETERQIRVQGKAKPISTQLADKYFAERNRQSQIVSIISNQGEELKNLKALEKAYADIESTFEDELLSRPENWSGFSIDPIRIEFLSFQSTRFHDRKLYTKSGGEWKCTQLKP